MANTTFLKAKCDTTTYALFVVPTLATDQTYTLPATGCSLGGNDYLATINSAEISITGAGITGTISRQHVCSGTTSDYTVTLPAASGNTGKYISFRMSTALTKVVTLDGNGGETIDGALTRIMWAGEWCVLYCDGSNWFKVDGTTIPMYGRLGKANASTTFAQDTSTLLDYTVNVALSAPAAFMTAATPKITILRPGNYYVSHKISTNGTNTSACMIEAIVYKNGAINHYNQAHSQASSGGTFADCNLSFSATYAANDYLQPYGRYTDGSFTTTFCYNDSANPVYNWFVVQEIPTW